MELEEEIERLEDEKVQLIAAKEALGRKTAELEVDVAEKQRLMNRHIETAKTMEKDNATLEAANAELESIFARWELPAFKDNIGMCKEIDTTRKMLQAPEKELEEASEEASAQIEALMENTDDQKFTVTQYCKTLSRFNKEWMQADKKIKGLQQLIQGSSNDGSAFVKVLIQKDATIECQEEFIDAQCKIHKALMQGYLVFGKKHHDLAVQANNWLNIGKIPNKRLAECEVHLQINGHAPPVQERQTLADSVKSHLGVNKHGSFDQDEYGRNLVMPKSLEVDDSPEGWVEGLVECFNDEKYDDEEDESVAEISDKEGTGSDGDEDDDEGDVNREEGQNRAIRLRHSTSRYNNDEDSVATTNASDNEPTQEDVANADKEPDVGNVPTVDNPFSSIVTAQPGSIRLTNEHVRTPSTNDVSFNFSNMAAPMTFSSSSPDPNTSDGDTQPPSPARKARRNSDIKRSKAGLIADDEEAEDLLLETYAAIKERLDSGQPETFSATMATLEDGTETAINAEVLVEDSVPSQKTATQKRNTQRKQAKERRRPLEAASLEEQKKAAEDAAEALAAAKAKEEKDLLTPHQRTLKRREARKLAKQNGN